MNTKHTPRVYVRVEFDEDIVIDLLNFLRQVRISACHSDDEAVAIYSAYKTIKSACKGSINNEPQD